ncbi:Holliday junction resolvase RuvX [Luteolibacter sp. GHJ8]|uniref:Putative pre-16S rRNA nuclease n=1 Tax=Luteolibacter rhizosphaerae TaxID=2989719 RepID=A0ABT3FY92_9BACT|nr:Holliday junction resolvase RuvX [Luteolibacter rhizosphaerae]MCW1912561.1 Holliday junction resolvase RuvX [Luteolibacter rhizosphaerae]
MLPPRSLICRRRAAHRRGVDGSDHHPALGIDHGEARIGIAATDPLGILAHPVETIEVRKTDAIERIAILARQRSVKTLVLGLPVRVDGTEGTAAEKVRGFGAKLSKRLPELPLVYVDEAYTTMDASAKLREAGRNAKQQKGIIDQAAAVAILDLWLESL